MSKAAEKTKGSGVRHRKVLRDNIQGLTKNALARILYRAGVKRISLIVYEEMRGILKLYVENFVKVVDIFVTQSRRKTVLKRDIYAAAKYLGIPILCGINPNAKTTKALSTCKSLDSKPAPRSEAPSEYRRPSSKSSTSKSPKTSKKSGIGKLTPKRPHRFRPGTVALRKIRKYQKNSDCLIFPKLNFARVVAEIYQDLQQDIRFQKGTIALIQLATEDYMVDLAEGAILAAIHADRETVFPRDFQLVRRLKSERA